MNKVFGKISDFSLIKEDASRVIASYGFHEEGDGNATWYEVVFYKKQNNQIGFEMVKQAILGDINARTDEKILSGFVWNNKPVWLSQENQFNFKSAYDLAVQTEGSNLPVKFKLGEDENEEPVYHTFTTVNSITDFHTKGVAYIITCLNEGWAEKDGVDWSEYEALFPEQKAAE